MTQNMFPDHQISWRTSSASANAGGQCVEAGPVNDGSGRVAVRHSKNPDGPMIVYTRGEWVAFVKAVQQGEYTF
jgi:hypothetical protein